MDKNILQLSASQQDQINKNKQKGKPNSQNTPANKNEKLIETIKEWLKKKELEKLIIHLFWLIYSLKFAIIDFEKM